CEQDDLDDNVRCAAWLTIQFVDVGVPRPLINATRRLTRRHECQWLRDMFCPFRLCAPGPASLTPAVTGLAEAIYRQRDFTGLPILADALEDAGCADSALLSHLRSPVPHVRGCWALDLVLGKG